MRLSQISKMRECEQVAAVCYRERRGDIEFLLVQTRGGGRWIFPKGSAEPGLTHAQAAAIEAFEEAGVHGRIEEASFVRYVGRRPGDQRNAGKSAVKALIVSAHLCEVLRLTKPKEANRNRTWFSVEETIQRLRDGRKNDDGEELARVVHRAAARIKRLRTETDVAVDPSPLPRHAPQDELHQVQFEVPLQIRGRLEEVSFKRRPPDLKRPFHAFTLPGGRLHATLPCEVLPFVGPRNSNRNSRLLSSSMKVKALGAGSKNG
jgi:8-oxo-dGTP pyrophosphatase MutT (NUDIX family)